MDYFDAVFGSAGAGGADTAQLQGSTGDDTLIVSPGSASLTGAGYSIRARSFAQIDARGGDGGHDQALLYDSSGNDHFQGSADHAMLTTPDAAASLYGFEYVRASASRGGNDTADVAAVDYLLEMIGPWGKS